MKVPPDWNDYARYLADGGISEYVEWREETGTPLPACIETGEDTESPCENEDCPRCNPDWLTGS